MGGSPVQVAVQRLNSPLPPLPAGLQSTMAPAALPGAVLVPLTVHATSAATLPDTLGPHNHIDVDTTRIIGAKITRDADAGTSEPSAAVSIAHTDHPAPPLPVNSLLDHISSQCQSHFASSPDNAALCTFLLTAMKTLFAGMKAQFSSSLQALDRQLSEIAQDLERIKVDMDKTATISNPIPNRVYALEESNERHRRTRHFIVFGVPEDDSSPKMQAQQFLSRTQGALEGDHCPRTWSESLITAVRVGRIPGRKALKLIFVSDHIASLIWNKKQDINTYHRENSSPESYLKQDRSPLQAQNRSTLRPIHDAAQTLGTQDGSPISRAFYRDDMLLHRDSPGRLHSVVAEAESWKQLFSPQQLANVPTTPSAFPPCFFVLGAGMWNMLRSRK